MKPHPPIIALVLVAVLAVAAPAQAHTFTVKLQRDGTALIVKGTLVPDDFSTHRVTIVVKRGAHTLLGTHVNLNSHGRFTVRLSPFAEKKPLTVRVSIADLVVLKTIH
jgi:hypothetical protein